MRNKGPWRNIHGLEIAVAEYIDQLNHRRLHGEIGLHPARRYENDHYPHHHGPVAADASVPSLH